MHAWGAVDLRNYLAKKNHGYSISAQSYGFCPRLIQLDILDFILSLNSICLFISLKEDIAIPVSTVSLWKGIGSRGKQYHKHTASETQSHTP